MYDKSQFHSETAGSLTPDLEGAAHSAPHPRRSAGAKPQNKDRGDLPSVKTDSPSAPKRP